MKEFMGQDFLLETATASHLYHDFSEKMPLIDYHCHLSPKEIYEDRRFSNISDVWFGGEQPDVLSVCENGFGKRTEFSEYKRQNRGGMGVITIKTSARNGSVVGIKLVDESKDLMIITEKGMTIRVRCADIRSVGRNAQGVTLAKMEPGDKIARIAPVVKDEEENVAEEK